MAKVRGIFEEHAAIQAVLDAHDEAIRTKTVFDVSKALNVLDSHGMSLIDNRLWDALESMPVGLDDLIDDEDEDE